MEHVKAYDIQRYRSLSRYMREVHGCKVRRLLVRGGFSCPNRDGTAGVGGCAFCDFASTFPSYTKGLSSVTEQLEACAAVAARRFKAERFMAYFHDGSATYAPVERLERLFKEALAFPGVVALAIGTRPDCLGREVLDLLEELNRETDLWLELGLQSASDRVLERLGRGHDVDCFVEGATRAMERGIKVCAHVVLGLPGEGQKGHLEIARLITILGVKGVKLHNFHVLKGARWADSFGRGEIHVPGMTEYTAMAADFLEHLPPRVVVHRLVGYARPEHLLAPGWTSDCWASRMVVGELESRGTWQGKALGHPRSALEESLDS